MKENIKESSFLGTGWSFPPRFDKNSGSAILTGENENIRDNIRVIISTLPGERIMHPEFGCDLDSFLFEEVTDGVTGDICNTVSDALLMMEPRIVVNSVEGRVSNETSGLLHVIIDYTVRSTNSRSNMVYPFYINEPIVSDFGTQA